MEVNRQRLATFFTELCAIESPSRSEGEVSEYLQRLFGDLGAEEMIVDDSAAVTGSDTGNLIIRLGGDESVGDPLFFACHMDTVGPTDGIQVKRQGDIFTSGGDTVLGADDKSGIAPLLELITLLRENNIPHCPIELVFTTCEEIGLRGAKAMNTSLLQAGYGYALDSTMDGKIITGAPVAHRVEVTIRGRAAHSGLAPETGINALALASHAISQLSLGRLDALSTANFGIISGGTAINIVPEHIFIEGEVRSHSASMLARHIEDITTIFNRVAEHWPERHNGRRATVKVATHEEFPLMRLEDGMDVLERIKRCSAAVDFPCTFDIAGGGSDANIFTARGKPTAIIPTGMTNVHSTEECVNLADMVRLTGLLCALVTDSTPT